MRFTWSEESIDCVKEDLNHKNDPLSNRHIVFKEIIDLSKTLIFRFIVLLNGKHHEEPVKISLRIKLVLN
jgi:hypothetical protein